MQGRTRIAPTPSGLLHRGNAIDFLLTGLIAAKYDLSILLRIDDLDAERVRPEYVQDVFDSLDWLGILPDEGPKSAGDLYGSWSQRYRMDRYEKLLRDLCSVNAIYGCTCTRSSLEGAAIYPGTCRGKNIPLHDPKAVWRIAVPQDESVIMRTIGGQTVYLDVGSLIGDVVVRQRPVSGTSRPAYQIASLADDIHFGITHIVRGEDLLPSTAIQLYMAKLLGLRQFQQVQFLHHPLVTNDRGVKLSKSAGSFSLQQIRSRGEAPDGILAEAREMMEQLFKDHLL